MYQQIENRSQIDTDEITVSRSTMEDAIAVEIRDYFSGTDWQHTLEYGAPLIARFALSRVLPRQSGKRSPEVC